MALKTYGRWPLVGTAALVPATFTAIGHPEARPLAGLLWHQTEEWVWPGGFLPWINREIIGSDRDDFPLEPRAGLIVNVVFGWGLSLLTLAGPRAAAPSAALYTSHLGNVLLHIPWAVRHRRYDPGAVTALLTLAPVAVTGLRSLLADPSTPRRAMGAGAALGIAVSAALPVVLRSRLRRR